MWARTCCRRQRNDCSRSDAMTNVRCGILVASALWLTAPLAASANDAKPDRALEHAHEVLRETILFDGHNDLPWAVRTDKQAKGDLALYDLRGRAPGHTDIERLRRG